MKTQSRNRRILLAIAVVVMLAAAPWGSAHAAVFCRVMNYTPRPTVQVEVQVPTGATPESVRALNAWMGSPCHSEHALSVQFEKTGIATAKDGKGKIYWVQLFAY